ncbi:hypothetical protein, partial [Marivita sp.]|uniref:hypothetical protein n=1 Tax=Marivita sp. TaxID=2003365 RepID=UPI0025C29CF7
YQEPVRSEGRNEISSTSDTKRSRCPARGHIQHTGNTRMNHTAFFGNGQHSFALTHPKHVCMTPE